MVHSTGSVVKAGLSRAYHALPDPIAAIASEAGYRFSRRPMVCREVEGQAVISPEKPTVVFSIDFEMAWAWRFARRSPELCVERGLHERAQVPKLVRVFNDYGIPATWATVGHLFLDSCRRGSGGLPHDDLPHCGHFSAEQWEFTTGDWYQHDPCTDVRRDPAWYAPDLIEQIANAGARHEIGCHTFSHMGLGQYCTPEIATAEIEACNIAMRRFGLEPKSFVFPGNDPGNFDVLARGGMTSVRWFPVPGVELSGPFRSEEGILLMHGSMPVESRLGRWNTAVRLLRMKSYLRRAIHESLVLHIWFHPSLQTTHIIDVLDPFLRHCAELREKGIIDVHTMGSLALAIGTT